MQMSTNLLEMDSKSIKEYLNTIMLPTQEQRRKKRKEMDSQLIICQIIVRIKWIVNQYKFHVLKKATTYHLCFALVPNAG